MRFPFLQPRALSTLIVFASSPDQVAERAYQIADEMIRERSK